MALPQVQGLSERLVTQAILTLAMSVLFVATQVNARPVINSNVTLLVAAGADSGWRQLVREKEKMGRREGYRAGDASGSSSPPPSAAAAAGPRLEMLPQGIISYQPPHLFQHQHELQKRPTKWRTRRSVGLSKYILLSVFQQAQALVYTLFCLHEPSVIMETKRQIATNCYS